MFTKEEARDLIASALDNWPGIHSIGQQRACVAQPSASEAWIVTVVDEHDDNTILTLANDAGCICEVDAARPHRILIVGRVCNDWAAWLAEVLSDLVHGAPLYIACCNVAGNVNKAREEEGAARIPNLADKLREQVRTFISNVAI